MNNRMLLNKNPKDRNSNSLRLIGKEGTYLYTAIIKQYATVVRIEESMTMRDNIFIMN
ncbi:MAG: hypothetical protein ACOYEA_06310 [Fermentimonas sp.]